MKKEYAKLKIANLIDRMDVGGAERVILTFTDVFTRLNKNYVVDIVVFENSPIAVNLESEYELKVLDILHKERWRLKNINKLLATCNQYNIVQIHLRSNFIFVYLFKKLGLIKAKVILFDHYGKIDADKAVPYKLDSIFRPDFFIGVSKTLTDWAINQLHMPTNRVLRLENIVTQNVKAVTKSVSPLNATPHVVVVSNIKRIKNQLFAIKLAKKLGFTLTLIGQVWEADYFKEMTDYIETNKLSNQIFFIHDCQDVQPILHHFDIGLHCAQSETGPLSILEFLACGLPLLSYNTGQSAQAIGQYTQDYICHTFNEAEWEEKFLHVVANYENYVQKSNELFALICNEQAYMTKADEFYKQIALGA